MSGTSKWKMQSRHQNVRNDLHLPPNMAQETISLQKDILERSQRKEEVGSTPGERVTYRQVLHGPTFGVASGREHHAQAEALVDRNEAVELESVEFKCDITILVPTDNGQELMKVEAVLDSGSRVTCMLR